jgi:hypothetical protein
MSLKFVLLTSTAGTAVRASTVLDAFRMIVFTPEAMSVLEDAAARMSASVIESVIRLTGCLVSATAGGFVGADGPEGLGPAGFLHDAITHAVSHNA